MAHANSLPPDFGRPDYSIAVVGMAGRFPGAEGLAEYWLNLRDGKETIARFSEQELRAAKVPEASLTDPGYVRARGIVTGVEYFDASFFGFSPRFARILDPQQRIWLECVHTALEDAGQTERTGEEVVGVFAGARESTYVLNNLCVDDESQQRLLALASADDYQIFISNDRETIATRTSYVFDFTGPSVNVQSACSTSLVAVARACWSLANHESDLCIAGGVCVTLPVVRGYHYQEGGIYSPDGHCRAFDAQACGTVFSDGAGAVVLKRLQEAERDGDRVHAVIRGWAVNNDGSEKASYTAPSAAGQAEVIALAQRMAAIDPLQVSYVETHGTGTQVGDPIEVAGLTEAFQAASSSRQFCGLGSVKTNIGHLDTAAGIAGLIKTVLALKHRQLPPTLHFSTPNPRIDFANSPFYVVDHLQDWPADGARIAGVSSFGVGGTNCHVVLEQAPEREKPAPGPDHTFVITLSAKTEPALAELSARYQSFLATDTQTALPDLAFTTNARRRHHQWRRAIVADSLAEVCAGLSGSAESPPEIFHGRIQSEGAPPIGFLFPGQGAQYAQMARRLYDEEPEFRRVLDRCDALLRPYLDQALLSVLYSNADHSLLVDRTDYTQPALFAVEYALTELWRSWGVEPSWVMGHSLGEYVAACVAGVFSLEEGLQLVAERGRLMNALPSNGSMAAVFADLEKVAPLLRPLADRLAIAALNSAQHVVISGCTDAVRGITGKLQNEGVYCRDLEVSQAFHSPLIEPILAPLESRIAEMRLRAPRIAMVSNLTGAPAGDELATAAYWRDHSRYPVRFAEGVKTMAKQGCRIFLEVGPHAVLSRFGSETVRGADIAWLPGLQRGKPDWRSLADAVGQLYVRGVEIDWPGFHGHRHAPFVDVPAYPFQRERFWIDDHASPGERGVSAHRRVASVINPMLGRRLRLPGSEEIRYETEYCSGSPSYLRDHRLFDRLVVPGASHLAMFAQAAEDAFGSCPCRFTELVFLRPMFLAESSPSWVQLVFSRDSKRRRQVQLMSAAAGTDAFEPDGWSVNVAGHIEVNGSDERPAQVRAIDLDEIRARATHTLTGAEFYSEVWGNAAGTGKAFRWIDAVWKRDGEAIARARRPAAADDGAHHRLHPGIIEASFQVLHCCQTFETVATVAQDGVIYVPFSIDEFWCCESSAARDDVWCHATLRDADAGSVIADLCVYDPNGRRVAHMRGLCLRKLSRDTVRAGLANRVPRSEPRREPKTGPPTPVPADGLVRRLAMAPADQQVSVLVALIQQQAADVSGYPEARFHPDASLVTLGFDSLQAVGLANRIRTALGLTLPLAAFLSPKAIRDLGRDLHRTWLQNSGKTPPV